MRPSEIPPEMVAPKKLTVKQAAQRLDCSKSLVYALCAAGRLRHYRIGVGRGTIRIEEHDLESVKQEAPNLDPLIGAGLKHLSMSG